MLLVIMPQSPLMESSEPAQSVLEHFSHWPLALICQARSMPTPPIPDWAIQQSIAKVYSAARHKSTNEIK